MCRMSPEHTPRLTPLPGHAVRDAVLEAARRKRSARPYLIPGVLITGLATPVVALGAADDVVPIPSTGTTAITETATTPRPDTTTATTTTATAATTAVPEQTTDSAPQDAA